MGFTIVLFLLLVASLAYLALHGIDADAGDTGSGGKLPPPPSPPPPTVSCGDHGAYSQADGSCKCTDGYIGDQCQAPPAEEFPCEKFSTTPWDEPLASQLHKKCRNRGFDRLQKNHDCGILCPGCQWHKYTCENSPNDPASKYPNKKHNPA